MADPVSPLIERYDREAGVYADLWAPVLRAASLKLLPELGKGSVARVLDVGTGVGNLLPDLARAFPDARVMGVDRSPGMLALAPRRFDRAVMDAERLAVRGASVDRVLMLFMLFHVDAPRRGLSEARRVLRPGGLAGTITWGTDLESRATEIWTECLDAHGAAQVERSTVGRHDHVNSAEKIEACLAETGFVDRRCWAEDFVHPLNAEHLIRLRTGMGSEKPRFDSLEPDAQAACVRDARERMSELPADAFVARAQLVCSVARA